MEEETYKTAYFLLMEFTDIDEKNPIIISD